MMQQLDLFAAPPTPPPAIGDDFRPKWARDWDVERTHIEAALARNAPEVIRWGKERGQHYQIELLRDGDMWRVRTSYEVGSGGGGGPFGRPMHKSRDEALTATLRGILNRCAKSATGGWGVEDRRSYEALAKWAIEQGPPMLFGGVDLRAEYEARVVIEKDEHRRRGLCLQAAHAVEAQAKALLVAAGRYGYDKLIMDPPQEVGAPGLDWHHRFIADWYITGSVEALELVVYPREHTTPEQVQLALDLLAGVEGATLRLCREEELQLCCSDRSALHW